MAMEGFGIFGANDLSSLLKEFKSYCLFCLRHLGEGSLHNYVRSNPRKIKSFRQILSYLTGAECRPKAVNGNNGSGVGLGVLLSQEEEEVFPPMCQPCYEIMADIYHLHKDLIRIQHLLQKQTLTARMTVLKTTIRSGSKAVIPREKFEAEVGGKSGLSTTKIRRVKAFVDKLHHAIIGEGTKSVKICKVLPAQLMTFPNIAFLEKCQRSPFEEVPEGEVKMEAEVGLLGSPLPPSQDDHDNEWPDEEMEANCEVTGDETDHLIEMDVDESQEDLDDVEVTTGGGHADIDRKPELSSKISRSPVSAKSSTSKFPLTHPGGGGGFVNGNNSQICDLCGEVFHVSTIAQHLESHVGDYVSKCANPNCHYAFSSQTKMDAHLLKSKKCRAALNIPTDVRTSLARAKQCDNCGFQTNSPLAFKNHLETHEHEMTEKGFPCPIQDCENRYSLRQSVDIHLSSHDLRRAKVWQNCTICSTKLHVNNIAKHLAEVHQLTDANTFPCNQCKFIYTDKARLIKHLGSHGQESWYCDVCNDAPKFLRHFSLVKHHFEVHQVGEQYLCDQCEKVFFVKTSLQSHRKNDHTGSGRNAKTPRRRNLNVKCDICIDNSALFRSQADMYVHKIMAHGAERFICDIDSCRMKFTRKCYLLRHKRVKHDGFQGEERHKCDVEGCGFIANNKTQLEDHKGSKHSVSGERRHICDICGKGYNWTDALRKHKKRVHDRLRQVCEVCGESFSNMAVLQAHTLIHTGERPYSCHICSQPFRQKGALRNHIKSHKRWGDKFKTTGPRENVARRVFKKKKD